MRSRYSAFVLRNESYLRTTWHHSHRPRKIDFDDEQVWLSLSVIDTHVISPESAEVEFIACSRLGRSKVQSHRERSRFVREGGKWFYVDGRLS